MSFPAWIHGSHGCCFLYLTRADADARGARFVAIVGPLGWTTYEAPGSAVSLDSGTECGADGMGAAVWSLTEAGVLADGAPVHVIASLT